MNPTIFARLAKYDETTGYFEAIAADETLDKAQEIFDYEKSKPHFVEWSSSIAKATDGQSVGNVRAMHGKTVAGKLTKLEFDDANRAIKVAGMVVDANEREKMSKGCYTGVSIGGSYVGEKWPDAVHKGAMRYAAKPTEVSIVDLPCNPAATFMVVKADKTEELRKFEVPVADNVPAPLDITESEAEAVRKYAELAGSVMPPEVKAALQKIARRKDVSSKEGTNKYGDVKFADEKNHKYPIDTAAHIRAAWNYINKAKNAAKYDAKDVASIKAKIVAAWKDKIDPKGPPSAEKADVADMHKAAVLDCAASVLVERAAADPKVAKQLQKLATFLGQPLEKGLWSVSRLADCLQNLQWIICDAECEAATEDDGSTVPAQLQEAASNLGHILLTMATEELDEAFGEEEDGEEEDEADSMKALAAGNLKKYAAKAGKPDVTALTKRATDAEAKVAGLEKAVTEGTEKVKLLEKDIADGGVMMKKAAERIAEQAEVINKIMAQPTAARPRLFAFSKSGDALPTAGEAEVEVVKNADGSINAVGTALRKALSKPVVVRAIP